MIVDLPELELITQRRIEKGITCKLADGRFTFHWGNGVMDLPGWRPNFNFAFILTMLNGKDWELQITGAG